MAKFLDVMDMFSPNGIYFVKIFLKENFTEVVIIVYLLVLNFHRFLLEFFQLFHFQTEDYL